MPTRLVAALIGLCLTLSGGLLAAPAASAASQVLLSVPADAQRGLATSVTLRLPKGVAAVDGRLLMRAGAGELIGIAPVGGGESLAPTEVEGGYAFGAFGLRATRGRPLLQLVVVPRLAGRLELRVMLDAAADSRGRPIALAGAEQLLRVRVDRKTRALAAPGSLRRAARPHAVGESRDLFAEGVISGNDLDVARAAWYRTRGHQQACRLGGDAAADANGDGCIDALDLQVLRADMGKRLPRSAAVPQAPLVSAAAPIDARVVALAGAAGDIPLATADAFDRTFTVDSTLDTPDAAPGNGACADSAGRCTLRAAIVESNWQPGHNLIRFNLAGEAPVTIQLGSGAHLPNVGTTSSSVTIDGYSQPGSRPNTAQHGTNAIPGVEIRGVGSSTRYGLYVPRPGSTIRGLLINNTHRGIFIDTANGHANTIVGNWLGFNRDGTLPPRGYAGVLLNNGAHDNVVGTPALADRNYVGNWSKAIFSHGGGTDGNVIQNNVLCIGPDGQGAICQTAIDYDFGPKGSLVGGTTPGAGNVVGPNCCNAIEFSHGWDPALGGPQGDATWLIRDHQVIGNWFGFRPDGTYDAAFRAALSPPTFDNGQAVNIYDGVTDTLIEGNYMTSAHDGVTIGSTETRRITVRGNVVGRTPHGDPAPLGGWGIYLRWNTREHVVEGNHVANAPDGGIGLLEHNVFQVRISRNIISDTSGPPIYLAPDPANPSTGANELLPPPTLAATTAEANGTGIAGATVEVYRASRAAGAVGLPVEFLGSVTVGSNGQWALGVASAEGERLTALQIRADGTTSELSVNAAVGGPAQAPSASFSWNQAPDSLRVDFADTSAGAPTSWSWDFGDGRTSTAQSPSHTYATPGDYAVELTVSNASGSDTQLTTVSVSAVDPGTTLAADDFERAVSGGWGSADVGGSYTLLGSSSSFNVSGGSGQIVLSAGASRRATLEGAVARDVDILVRVRTDKPTSNGSHYIYLVARRSGGNAYRPKLVVAANGQVSVHAGVVIDNSESSLGPSVAVPGASPANGWTWLRAQVTGAGPTMIRVKAWADGAPEPTSWQFEASNSHAALQDVGSVGLMAYISGSISNAPVTLSFDDYTVSTAAPPPPPPAGVSAADQFERTVSGGWGSADTGGAYAYQGPLSSFNVESGVGTMLVPTAGVARSALLDSPSARDVDVRFRVRTDKTTAGGTWFVYAVTRRAGGSEYRPRLVLRPDGSIAAHASIVVNGSESPLGSAVSVPGLTHAANGWINFRAEVSGSGPTTIRVKAWAEGAAEPSEWQYSVTDSNAALQDAGSLGLRVYANSATTSAPITFSFDDFRVSDLP